MSEATKAAASLEEPRERIYFAAILIFSVLIWAILIVCGFGFQLLLCAVFIWLANGILVARIRNEAIEVTHDQFPVLQKALHDACSALGVVEVPPLYLLPSKGKLNQFTIRHASRPFVVLPAKILDSPSVAPAEIRFLLGFEIGRLKAHHALKLLLGIPGRFLPLLGSAYLRKSFILCDRSGAVAAHDPEAAARAIAPISIGSAELQTFAGQHLEDRGFFASWNELTSAQPTRSYRVARVLGKAPSSPTAVHPLAYPAALLTLSGFRTGFANLVFSVVLAVVVLGVAVPVNRAAKARAEVREARVDRQERLLSAKEILLTEGTIDPRLAGIWKGGSPTDSPTADYLHWTTARKMDGNLETSYEQRSNGVEKKWAKHGQWRMYKGKYQEIYDSEKAREYQVLKAEPDLVEMTEDPMNAGVRITEIRQPGEP